MADLKITALPALVEAGVQAVDVLALADLSATETKKITVKDLIAAGVALIDDGDIPAAKVGTLGSNQVATAAIVDNAVTNVKLANSSISLGGVSISLGGNDGTPAFLLTDATGYLTSNLSGTISNSQLAGSIAGTKLLDTTITYAKLNLSDGDIPGAKIATGGITATQLAANSVTASELADDAVDTAAIADGAVVAASIATDTITANQIAANAIGASELADNSVDAGAIAADAVTTVKILNANVTAAKLAADLPGTILATGAIGSTQLAANSVTASELADNAVDSGAIAASAVVDAKIASGIGGAKITDGTITAAKLATANIDRSLNVASGNLGINNTVVAATRSGITYNAQGLITGTVALAASDLPLATTSAVGGVSVGTGLAVTGAGALSLSNSVTAATISGITYNAQGQITATTGLVAGDLPAATTSAKGAVLITSGGGISVDGSGAISTSTSGITAGTYTKVTINNKGVATAGTSLVAGDIPNLAATKITSGTFDVGRFGTNTILGSKFADSSVCQFTGAQSTSGVVTFPTAEFKGQFFYDLTNDDLYVYDGSAFQPVTITSGEIIYAGNYRADTNKITSLTAAGTAQGFTQNAALQAASAANNRYYFVCDKSGTGTSPAPTVTINPPDMILSNGATWEKLDISNFIAGQVASNIGVTATGGIQNTNVQSVLEELDTEKLNLTGGTLTGNLALNQSSSIIFEGSTPDDFETTLTVIDPTADRTVSLPNVTGTLVSSGDTGTVTSTMILDGTILNADINASAAIALTKLANVTAAHIIVGNASNVPTAVAITGDISISNAGLVAITADSIVNADIKSDAAISGSKIVAGTTSVVGVVQLVDSATSTSTTLAATGASVKVAKDAADAAATTANAALATTGGTLTNNLIIDNAKQIRFTEADANGANYVSLQAPDTLAADVSYTLPSAAPTANGQVLAGTTAGVLSWTDDPTGQWVTSGSNVYYDGGNVGIGTGSSPAELLDVSSTGASAAIEISAGQASTTTGEAKLVLRSLHSSSGTSYSRSEIASLAVAGGDSDLIFRTTTQIAGPEDRMTIDSEGLVGIGTNPGTLFHIKEPTTSGAKDILHVESHGGGHFLVKCNDTAAANPTWQLRTYASEDIQIAPGNTVALTLNSSDQSATFAGNVDVNGSLESDSIHTAYRIGVGAAATDFGSGVSTLLLQGRSSTRAGCIDFKEYSSGTRLANIFVQNDATYGLSIGTQCSGEAGDFIRFHTNALGTEALRLDSSQNATFAGKLLVDGATAYDAFNSSSMYIDGYVCMGRTDTTISDGNQFGGLRFYSNDTNINSGNFLQVGCFDCEADGQGFLANDAPTRMVFKTMKDGTTTLTEALRLDSSQNAIFAAQIKINTVARIESTGEYKAPHGTAASPAYNFLNDNDNGMYRVTTNTLGFSTGGVHRLSITSDGKLQINRTVSSTSGNHPALEIETLSSGSEDSTFATGIDFKVDGVAKKRLAITNGSGEGGGDWIFYKDNGNNEALRIDSSGQKIIKNGNLNISSTYIDFSGSLGSAPSTAAAIYRPADNNLAFSTANVERLRILNGGDVSITDGNLVVANGHGIDFSAQTGTSATGAATGNVPAEVLAHYEEGTWDPVATFSTSGSVTVGGGGHFTRVGRIVVITWTFYTTSISSPSGNFALGGLPFACYDHSHARFGASFAFIREWNTDMPNFRGMIAGGDQMVFYKQATNGETSNRVVGSDFEAGNADNYIYGSATYYAA